MTLVLGRSDPNDTYVALYQDDRGKTWRMDFDLTFERLIRSTSGANAAVMQSIRRAPRWVRPSPILHGMGELSIDPYHGRW